MNLYKIPAIFFALFSIGAIRETFRVLTSDDLDIAANRNGLIPIAFIMTGIFIFFTIFFWKKSNKPKKLF